MMQVVRLGIQAQFVHINCSIRPNLGPKERPFMKSGFYNMQSKALMLQFKGLQGLKKPLKC